jgi:dolichyl-phosphate-mannose-protein mannosyltransferase
VFDEVYYAKFGQAYLLGVPQFDAHPPLGKYFVAASIWLNTQVMAWQSVFWGAEALKPVAGVGLPTVSYRWMTAFFGSLVPLVAIALSRTFAFAQPYGKQLIFVLLTGLFVATDGLFVTESRYALINIYLVFFGLLGHWLWLKKPANRLLAGVALGCAIATKWNGLGYILSLFVWELWQSKGRPSIPTCLSFLGYGMLVPAITYCLIWIPHLWLTQESFITVHNHLLTFHKDLSTNGHPACAKWYSWPMMIKPITYWYNKVDAAEVYTVNSMGNPTLWWLSAAVIGLLALEKSLLLKDKLFDWWLRRKQKKQEQVSLEQTSLNKDSLEQANLKQTSIEQTSIEETFSDSPLTTLQQISSASWQEAPSLSQNPVGIYLLIGYFTNWLPWVLVTRCTFIYLYMPSAVFAFMAIAWLLSDWLYPRAEAPKSLRLAGWIILGAIAIAFLYWLPFAIGSPISYEAMRARWWIKSWL